MFPAEKTLTHSFIWTTAGCAAAVPLLVVPAPEDPLLTLTTHLSLLVVFAVTLAFHLAPLSDRAWFTGTGLGAGARSLVTGAVIVAVVTAATALVTLATSAALRYNASLQYLQLLSILDITWAATALTLGLRRWLGAKGAVAGAAVLGVVCVWAIWRYLDVVGFTPSGGWVVSARQLRKLVLPYDMGAGLVAVVAFVVGMRRPARDS